MLDNALIYLISDMDNGSRHNNVRTPIILTGIDLIAGRAMDMGTKVGIIIHNNCSINLFGLKRS